MGLPLGFGQDLESSSYAWVIVDWRGFYASASAAVPSPKRGEDGYDVIDWIVAQPWSNGKVGTWGPSALGVVQYQTAKENHPGHICAVPLVAHPQTHYGSYFYGGVLEKSRLATLDLLGYGLSPFVLGNPYYNFTWQTAESLTWYPSSIKIPMLQIGGWYDHNINKMTEWYKASRNSADVSIRDQQWLLVGPWVHGGTGAAYVGSGIQGELTYSDAAYESDVKALQFFAYYLLNSANNWTSTPKITYYELGINGWNTSEEDNIEIINTEDLLLNQNNILSDGTGSGFTSFICNPKNPSPTIGGPTLSLSLDQGPYDQSSLDSRSDVVTFSSNELLSDLTVSGRVKINLYIECDQPDADIAIRLTDVYPDGRSMLINDGIRRMRFRNGYRQSDEAFMTSGQVYNVEIELPFVNYTWKTGHKVKIYVSGNSATRWDVNLQNGSTMYSAGDTNTAVIRIHHSNIYQSKIIFPTNNSILTSLSSKKSGDVLFRIFPNPVNNVLNIHIPNDIQGEVNYMITDQLGKLIKKGILIESSIEFEEPVQGIYFIHLINGERSEAKTFFKK